MWTEGILAGSILVGLTLYALSGGADYGGGIWDLFATGPRARAQKETIASAIGPIWEANHVWLILVIVILFTAFPPAFARITTVLHIPLTLLAIGVVLRGSAFAFRSYATGRSRDLWSNVFAISSLISPLLLGVSLGAIAAGKVRPVGNDFTVSFVLPWWNGFSFAVGFLALLLFSYLAAIYLSLESEDRNLQNDFRIRALASGIAVGVVALLVLFYSRNQAPALAKELMGTTASIPLILVTGLLHATSLIAIWFRQYRIARLTGAGFVVFVLWGWGFAQFPYVVPNDLTFFNTAAPSITQKLLLIALSAGGFFLFPSFYYLFRVFKKA